MSTYGTTLNLNLCERNLLDVCFTPVFMHCSPLLTFPFSKTNKKQKPNKLYAFIYLSFCVWCNGSSLLQHWCPSRFQPLQSSYPMFPLGDFIYGCNKLKSISGPNQLDYYFQLLLPTDAIPTPQTSSKPWFFFCVLGQSERIHCSLTHNSWLSETTGLTLPYIIVPNFSQFYFLSLSLQTPSVDSPFSTQARGHQCGQHHSRGLL